MTTYEIMFLQKGAIRKYASKTVLDLLVYLEKNNIKNWEYIKNDN